MIIVLEIIYTVVNFEIPQNDLKSFFPYIMLLVIITVIIAMVLLVATYHFTRWFNEEITPLNSTKSFFYYGVLNVIGAVTTSSISTWSILSHGIIFLPVSGSSLIVYIIIIFIIIAGYICVVAAFIMEIVAGIKIYIRINDIITGKDYLKNQPINQQEYTQIEPNDLRIFRTLVVVFNASIILYLVGSLISLFIGNLASIFSVIGYIALTYGVYKLSKKYKPFGSSKKIIFLFLLIIILEISFLIVGFVIYPINFTSLDFAPINLLQIVISGLIALLFLVAMYNFTQWFNKEITPFNKTQVFWWFNLVNLIPVGMGIMNIYAWFGYNSIPEPFHSSREALFPQYVLWVFLLYLIIVVIGIIAFISVIVTGVAYSNNQPYDQQPSGQSKNFIQQTGTKICQNCGISLDPNSTFCGNCGIKI